MFWRIVGAIAVLALVLFVIGELMTHHFRVFVAPTAQYAYAATSSAPAASPSVTSSPSTTTSSSPSPSPSSSSTTSPSIGTTTAPVNQPRGSVLDLGTVAHHVGMIVVPKNGTIFAVGDLHQDGGLYYKPFNTPGPLNLNGIVGDAHLYLITINISGLNPQQITQALKNAVETYLSQYYPGAQVDP